MCVCAQLHGSGECYLFFVIICKTVRLTEKVNWTSRVIRFSTTLVQNMSRPAKYLTVSLPPPPHTHTFCFSLSLFREASYLTALSIRFAKIMLQRSIPLAIRSKAWVCGLSVAGVTSAIPAGDMDICLVSVVCCQIEVAASGWSLVHRRPSYRLWCVLCVILKPR
jgi:hypothetical protein